MLLSKEWLDKMKKTRHDFNQLLALMYLHGCYSVLKPQQLAKQDSIGITYMEDFDPLQPEYFTQGDGG